MPNEYKLGLRTQKMIDDSRIALTVDELRLICDNRLNVNDVITEMKTKGTLSEAVTVVKSKPVKTIKKVEIINKVI